MPNLYRLLSFLTGALGLPALALASFASQPLAGGEGGQSVPGARPSRPNIVFIFSDDHAPHAIGAYARLEDGFLAEVNPTPRIDRLAEGGMLFQNSFCTNSICGPSRAVILTGLHSFRNGFTANGQRFNGDQRTFPKMLQGVGYRTALFGKWHLGSSPQGFDDWEVLPGQGDYYNPKLISAEGERFVEGYCTDIVTDLAIEWLEENAKEGGPFLMMCQHKAPHRNWMPAPRHFELYADRAMPEPATLFDRWEDNARPSHRQEMEIDRHMYLTYDLFVQPRGNWEDLPGGDRSGHRNMKRMTEEQLTAWNAHFGPLNEEFNKTFPNPTPGDAGLVRWKYQRYIKNYLRCVRGVDESVGRIVDWLDETGLRDNTIVIYSSDQGFYLGDHGWYDKRWMYEESLRMPLVVSWPGRVPAAVVRQELVQNLDYAPTFLELAGVEVPEDMQGMSMLPLLTKEEPMEWRDAIYYHYHAFPAAHQVASHYGIRTQTAKLMHFYQVNEWEMYDLKSDPDELSNVFGDAEYSVLGAQLGVRLGELRWMYQDETDVREKPQEWLTKHGFPPEAGD